MRDQASWRCPCRETMRSVLHSDLLTSGYHDINDVTCQVGIWSVESSSRQSCVQGGQAAAQHSVTSLALVSGDKFLTGSTDCRLRL